MRKAFKIFLNIILYLLLAVVVVVIILGLSLSNKVDVSREYYNRMVNGKNSLEMAVDSLKKGQYSQAKNQSDEATTLFQESLTHLSDIRTNKVAANFFPITSSVNDLEYLTKTAEILSRSISRSSELMMKLGQASGSNQSFQNLSQADKRHVLETLYQATPELNGLKANLELALSNLNKINRVGVLLPLESQVQDIKSQLITAYTALDHLIPLSRLLPALAGYPQESDFFVALQNNDELRPTGGFIGTYGLVHVKDGELGKIVTEDIYHLDMPCVDKLTVTPPAPVSKYMGVKYWWLRDANWSPDWPTAAQQIQKMYLEESACTGPRPSEPTAIISINPNLIARLIDFVGPITAAGTTYTGDNFQPLLQYNVEVAYVDKDISSWDRKEIINDVVAELKNRLMQVSTNRLPELLEVVDTAIARRDLQVYFNNSNYQSVALDFGMGGEVKTTGGDYLMVVDTNLAAYKTDAVMRKNMSYELKADSAGLVATLKLKYIHEGGFDWRTTRYRSYTRILTPLGSELINHSGLDDFSVSTDLGKTVFGFFWSIEPGKQKEIYLSYRLPKEINAANYRLYFQKQSGSRLNNLDYLNTVTSQSWSGTLDRDKIFN